MTRIIFLVTLIFSGLLVSGQQTFTVTNSGLQFNPVTINAKIGDLITFNVGAMHPVLQVNESTYLANGSAAFPGGFSFPSGSGTYTASEAGTVYYICTSHISSGMKGKIEISQATSVQKPVSFTDFEIFPNPVDDHLNIKNPESSNPVSIIVFDMSGKMILKSGILNNENNMTSIFVNDLRKGLYFISVYYSDKTYTTKFIKL
jgi:plastocyanin